MNDAVGLQTEQFNAAGTAADRYQLYMQGVEAAQNRVTASLENLWQNGIESGLIVQVLDATSGLIDMIDAFGGLNTILPITIGLLVAFNAQMIVAKVAGFASAVGALANTFGILAGFIPGIATAGATAALAATGVGLLVIAVVALAGGLYYASKEAERNVEALDKSTQAMKQLSSEMDRARDEARNVESLWREYETLRDKVSKTADETQRYVDVQNQLVGIIPQLEGAYDDEYNFIIDEKVTLAEILEIEKERLAIKKEELALGAEKAAKDAAKVMADKEEELSKIREAIANSEADTNQRVRELKGSGADDSQIDSFLANMDANLATLKAKENALEKDLESYKNTFKAFYKSLGKEAREAFVNSLDPAFVTDEIKAIIVDVESDPAWNRMLLGLIDKSASNASEGSGENYKDAFITSLDEAINKMKEMYEVQRMIADDAPLEDIIARLQEMKIEFEIGKDGVLVAADAWNVYEEATWKAVDATVAGNKELENTANAARRSLEVTVSGTQMTRWAYEQMVNEVSGNIYKLATDNEVTLRDMNGIQLLSVEATKQAMISNVGNLTAVIKQMVREGYIELSDFVKYVGQFSKWANFKTPYKPPAFGGGSGTGGSTASEKTESKSIMGLLNLVINKIKEEKEAEKDLLQEQLKGFKKVIDARKEVLDLMKAEKKAKDDLADKQKAVSKIEANLIEMQFDNSQEAIAARLVLEEDLAGAKTDLDDYLFDQSIEKQKDALDIEYAQYEEQLNAQIALIDAYLEKTGVITIDALNRIRTEGDGLYQSLIEWNRTYGTGLDEDVIKPWEEAYDLIIKFSGVLNSMPKDYTFTVGVTTTGSAGGSGGGSGSSTNSSGGSNTWEGDYGLVPGGSARHNGLDLGPIGDKYALKSNEEFVKLLKGETVATPGQMDNFMTSILPTMLGASFSNNSSGGFNIGKLLEITVNGSLDKTVLPDINTIVNKAVEKLNQAMHNKGYMRKANTFST